MATQGEKIEELSKLAAALNERVDNLREQVIDLRELIAKVAVLEQKVEDLRAGGQEWARRLWMILAPLVSGILGALLLYYLGVKK